jgi:hypothetical protein
LIFSDLWLRAERLAMMASGTNECHGV